MARRCRDCAGRFEQQRRWHELCWPCWRAREDLRHWDQGYYEGQLATEHADVPTELLRAVVVLCHPDRHPPKRAELATQTTVDLLSVLDATRPRIRRAA